MMQKKKNDIIQQRLINQQIAGTTHKEPQEIVAWLGAMQAQEYAMSKWAIGLRLPGSDDTKIEKACNDGTILRTHLLRPTWHFVTPADIRWLLVLTAPRICALSASMFRKLELDDKTFKRSNALIEKTLRDGKHLTRRELNAALEKGKINANGLRLIYIMMRAELEGIVCSGPRKGKQSTYALLEERVPFFKHIDKEESLARLAHRYIASRGPATLQDFVTWSGLTVKEARQGLSSLDKSFLHEMIDGKEYLFLPSVKTFKNPQTTFLMPDYDEYGMGYKDRSAIFNPTELTQSIKSGNPVFNRMIIIDGKIAGTWQRILKKDTVEVNTFPFVPLSKEKQEALTKATQRYQSFVMPDQKKEKLKKRI